MLERLVNMSYWTDDCQLNGYALRAFNLMSLVCLFDWTRVENLEVYINNNFSSQKFLNQMLS